MFDSSEFLFFMFSCAFLVTLDFLGEGIVSLKNDDVMAL